MEEKESWWVGTSWRTYTRSTPVLLCIRCCMFMAATGTARKNKLLMGCANVKFSQDVSYQLSHMGWFVLDHVQVLWSCSENDSSAVSRLKNTNNTSSWGCRWRSLSLLNATFQYNHNKYNQSLIHVLLVTSQARLTLSSHVACPIGFSFSTTYQVSRQKRGFDIVNYILAWLMWASRSHLAI